MNFEPSEPMRANPKSFPKEKQPSDKIISDMIEVGRNGVYSTPEVKVVRKIKVVYFSEIPSNAQF